MKTKPEILPTELRLQSGMERNWWAMFENIAFLVMCVVKL